MRIPGSKAILDYQTPSPSDGRANGKAERLNHRGIEAFEDGKLDVAEELFRKALAEDVSYGSAHNNLGQVYLARQQLYLAAWEFEYAASLMPNLAEPLINQALAYERADRLETATAFYRQALERKSDHPDAIGGLTRVLIQQDEDPGEIAFLLDELSMRDSRPQWQSWAQLQRATAYRDAAVANHPAGLFEPGTNKVEELFEGPAQPLETAPRNLTFPKGGGVELLPSGESEPDAAPETLELPPPLQDTLPAEGDGLSPWLQSDPQASTGLMKLSPRRLFPAPSKGIEEHRSVIRQVANETSP